MSSDTRFKQIMNNGALSENEELVHVVEYLKSLHEENLKLQKESPSLWRTFKKNMAALHGEDFLLIWLLFVPLSIFLTASLFTIMYAWYNTGNELGYYTALKEGKNKEEAPIPCILIMRDIAWAGDESASTCFDNMSDAVVMTKILNEQRLETSTNKVDEMIKEVEKLPSALDLPIPPYVKQ